MPTLYNRVYGLSLDQALRAGTLTNVAQVAILLVCAFAIDRVGRRRWMTTCFVAGAVLLVGLGFFGAGSVTAVMALVTLSYGIVGSVNTVLYLYTPEIYPTRMRAIGTGAATCWLRLASAAGPLLVGYLVVESGPAAVFLMFAAPACWAHWRQPSRSKRATGVSRRSRPSKAAQGGGAGRAGRREGR